jgi:hypothetical protein
MLSPLACRASSAAAAQESLASWPSPSASACSACRSRPAVVAELPGHVRRRCLRSVGVGLNGSLELGPGGAADIVVLAAELQNIGGLVPRGLQFRPAIGPRPERNVRVGDPVGLPVEPGPPGAADPGVACRGGRRAMLRAGRRATRRWPGS